MHLEIQVALNFVISYLYNKLPRRRVNILGEELDKALKEKFQGHWYPEKPFKGSAFRCLKTGDPVDPVLERAAQESGIPVQDILENLPQDLAVWIDPNEVSYRIGEKGAVKILYTDHGDALEDTNDREVTKTFNPEAQCFRPIESVSSSISNLSLSPKSVSPYEGGSASPTPPFVKPSSPTTAFMPRTSAPPLTFTTATFAQTKFGSTKLKTSSKRANRMSPTEFSNYIKQRALQQQLHQQNTFINQGFVANQTRPRSLSPNPQLDDFFQTNNSFSPFSRTFFDTTATNSSPFGDIAIPSTTQQSKFPFGDSLNQPFYPNQPATNGVGDSKPLLEGLNFGGLNTMPYPSNQYQHLLVAN